MAEYVEKKAAKKFMVSNCVVQEYKGVLHNVVPVSILDKFPAADVVEVVRCKDCKYYKQNTWGEEGEFVCKFWIDWLSTEEDDFCSYGERRSE